MCLDGPTFVATEGWDWIPAIRDRDTGIWQPVTLTAKRCKDWRSAGRDGFPCQIRAAPMLRSRCRSRTFDRRSMER